MKTGHHIQYYVICISINKIVLLVIIKHLTRRMLKQFLKYLKTSYTNTELVYMLKLIILSKVNVQPFSYLSILQSYVYFTPADNS